MEFLLFCVFKVKLSSAYNEGEGATLFYMTGFENISYVYINKINIYAIFTIQSEIL